MYFQMWAVIVMLVILISVLVLGLESLESMRVTPNSVENMIHCANLTNNRMLEKLSKPHGVIIAIELTVLLFLTGCFCFGVGVGMTAGYTKYWRRSFAWPKSIAAASLLPSWFIMVYIYLWGGSCECSEIFSVFCRICYILRLLRVFFMCRLARYYRSLAIMMMALNASRKELLLLGILLFFCATIYGSLIYYIELSNDKIHNIPFGYWWALVTMTTVGYGDVYPVSTFGYIIGSACAITGILIIALPVPVISQNFTIYYQSVKQIDRMQQRECRQREREKVKQELKTQERKNLPLFENVTRTPIGWDASLSRTNAICSTASSYENVAYSSYSYHNSDIRY